MLIWRGYHFSFSRWPQATISPAKILNRVLRSRDSSEIKVTINLFWKLTWMFLYQVQFRKKDNTVKTDTSPCSLKTCDALILLVLVGSWMPSLLNNYLPKNLTGRNRRAYGTVSYEICWKITLFKTTPMQNVHIVVLFAVIICLPK